MAITRLVMRMSVEHGVAVLKREVQETVQRSLGTGLPPSWRVVSSVGALEGEDHKGGSMLMEAVEKVLFELKVAEKRAVEGGQSTVGKAVIWRAIHILSEGASLCPHCGGDLEE